jgi:transcriptional regulator with XRE-family HTH domain
MFEVSERFAENLIRCRKRLGLSQENAAFRASIHRTEWSLLERGVRCPRIDTLVRLAGGLGVTPNDLLKGIVWKPGERRQGGFTT